MADHDARLWSDGPLTDVPDSDLERLCAYRDDELTWADNAATEQQLAESEQWRHWLGEVDHVDAALRAVAGKAGVGRWADLVIRRPTLTGERHEDSVLFNVAALDAARALAAAPELAGLGDDQTGSGLIRLAQLEPGAAADAATSQPLPAVVMIQRRTELRAGLLAMAAAILIATVGLLVALELTPQSGDATIEQHALATADPGSQRLSPAGNSGFGEAANAVPLHREVVNAGAQGARQAIQVLDFASRSATARRSRTRVARNRQDGFSQRQAVATRRRSRGAPTDPEPSSARASHHRRGSRAGQSAARQTDPIAAALARVRPSASATAMLRVDAAADRPLRLPRRDVRRALERAQNGLTACRDQAELLDDEVLRVDLMLTIDPDGRISSAQAQNDSPAATCVLDVTREVRFAQFSGPAMTLTYPIRVY